MNQPQQPGYYVRMHRNLRHWLVLGLLSGLAVVCAWLLLQRQADNAIRLEVERRFAAHYPGYRVTVRGARLVEGSGIEIQGLAVYRRPEVEPLVYVHEIMAVSPVSLRDLVRGHQPQAEQLVLRGARLRGRQDEQGHWDLARLWPPPKFGPRTPRVMMQDTTVHLSSGQGPAARTISARDLQVEIIPQDDQSGYAKAPGGAGNILLVRGTGTADHLERLQFEAILPAEAGIWDLRGEIGGLRLSPELYQAIPEPWRKAHGPLESLKGRVSFAFHVWGDSRTDAPPRFAVTGDLTDGEISDRRLPCRLYDARARFRWDDQQLAVEHFFARNGVSELELSWIWKGLTKDSPMSIEARARRLKLDQRFADSLPQSLRQVWDEYSPSGEIDAEVRLEFDGRRWHPQAEVTCRDVSLVYHQFPYRLQRVQGQISLADDVLSIRLQAGAGEQTVTINGQLNHPAGDATGWLEISCPHPIPLDRKLLNAVIDPDARRVLESLHPGGALTVAGRFERRQPGGPIHRLVTIDLHDCSMRYDRFPYPLGMIRGTVVWDDHGWTFKNLSGRNRSGYIECQGSWTSTDDGGSLLTLDFVGTAIGLEDELRDALHPDVQQVWRNLRPQGAIDRLRVLLQYRSAQDKLSVEVYAREWEKRFQDEGRSISVAPKSFPYRLDDLTGTVVYRNGEVSFQQVSARHEGASISLDGQSRFGPDGRWSADVANLVVERIRFDPELLNALPQGLSKAIKGLSLRGNVGVQGALALRGVAGQPPAVSWDVNVDLENVSLDCGPLLEHLHGEVRLAGRSTAEELFSRGELNIDSLIHQGVQVTQIRGPLLIEPDRVVLGTEAERGWPDVAPRSLVGQAFGGTLSADIAVGLDSDVPFHLRAAVEGGDLQQFAHEVSPSSRDIRGKANVVVNLRGTAQGRHTWRGDGFLRLYEADIYQVPVMLALLNLLRIRQPDLTAFTSSNIDFRILGEHLYFDRIDLDGDVISLRGHGEMNLDRQIDMKFYTLVGRREWEPAALHALLHQAAQQILLVHATGTLDQPHLTREPLPMVRETLEQLFPEAASRNQPFWMNLGAR